MQYNTPVLRLRRLILKLTVACAVIPLVVVPIALMMPMIGEKLGRSGHRIGDAYVVRYSYDSGAIRIYRKGYPLITLNPSEAPTRLALYGVFVWAWLSSRMRSASLSAAATGAMALRF